MTDKRTDLPSTGAANFQQRLRETVMTYLGRQGDPLDRGLTLRDLIDAGLVKIKSGFKVRPGADLALEVGEAIAQSSTTDLSPPPAPTGFAATAAISHILIEHDAPVYTAGHGHLRTHLYGATWTSGPLPTFANAVELAQFSGNVYALPSQPATTWHLWIKWETVDGTLSAAPAGGTNGVVVTTGQDVAKLLDALAGEITTSQLDAALTGRIDLIDGSGAGSVNARIATETQARTAAVGAETAARVAAISAEAQARSDAIAIETNQRILGITAAANAALDAALAVDNERSARAADVSLARTELTENFTAGIQAEATQRTLLAARLVGNYTGTDINQVTSGLLYQERLARATQDGALAQQITLLSAGAGEQFDWTKIWYFDAGIEGWSGNGTPTFNAGWLRPADATSGAYVASPTALNVDALKYSQMRLRVRKGGAPTFTGYLWWKRPSDTTWDTSRRVSLTAPTWDANGIGLVTANPAWTGTIDQIRLDLSDAQTASNYFELDWVAIGRPSPGASSSQLLEEAAARADADSTEVFKREQLASSIIGATDPSGLTLGTLSSGLLYQERTARSTADGALAGSITTLQGQYNTLSGTVTTVQEAAATANTAAAKVEQTLLATDRKLSSSADRLAEAALRDALAVEAERVNRTGTMALLRTETYTRIEEGLAAEAAQRTTLAAQVNANQATLNQEISTRTSQTGALTQQINALSAQVNSADTGLPATRATLVNDYYTKAATNEAIASSATTLTTNYQAADTSTLTQAQGYVQGYAYSKSAADAALVAAGTTLTTNYQAADAATLNSAKSYVESYAYSKSAADAATAGQVNAVSARLNIGGDVYQSIVTAQNTASSKSANFVQATAPTATKTGDLWIDTSSGNKLKQWSGGAWVDADDTRIGSQANSITQLNSRLNDVSGSGATLEQQLSTSASQITGLQAQYTVKVDVAGQASGFGLAATGPVDATVVWSAVSSGILAASANQAPHSAIFKESINGRLLGDIDGAGTVTAADALMVTQYGNGTLAAGAAKTYIETVLAPTLKANPAKYIAYLSSERTAATSMFGIRADSFYVAPAAIVSASAPTTNLYDGLTWLDTSVSPPVNRYYKKSDGTWSLSPTVVPFVVRTSPTTINGQSVDPGVYISSAVIQDATITNAKIANLAIDDSKVAGVSAGKLTAGAIEAGRYISSTGYEAGSSGWIINGDGTAELANAVVRGTIYASAGEFTGTVKAGSTLLGGSATSYTSGTGLFGGVTDATYTWRVGSPNGARIQWTGSGIEVYNDSNQLTLSSGGVSWDFISSKPSLGAMSALDKITLANAGTYIDTLAIGGALIADSAITSAKIGNAEIGTLKIQNFAVSNYFYASGFLWQNGSSVDIQLGTLPAGARVSVILQVRYPLTQWNSNWCWFSAGINGLGEIAGGLGSPFSFVFPRVNSFTNEPITGNDFPLAASININGPSSDTPNSFLRIAMTHGSITYPQFNAVIIVYKR